MPIFAMSLDQRAILESQVTAERRETLGRIDEATYLGRAQPSFWARLWGREAPATFLPPFDGTGRDVHGLLRDAQAELDGLDDPLGEIRLARGRVVPLLPRQPGDEVPVRDGWGGRLRLVRAEHFGLEVPGQARVAVAFAQSPLVIGVPQLGRLEDVLEPSERAPLAARLHDPLDGPAGVVSIRLGDEVEVLGAVASPEQCRGRFDLTESRASYRDAPEERVSLVIGDRQGLRMVLRRCGP